MNVFGISESLPTDEQLARTHAALDALIAASRCNDALRGGRLRILLTPTEHQLLQRLHRLQAEHDGCSGSLESCAVGAIVCLEELPDSLYSAVEMQAAMARYTQEWMAEQQSIGLTLRLDAWFVGAIRRVAVELRWNAPDVARWSIRHMHDVYEEEFGVLHENPATLAKQRSERALQLRALRVGSDVVHAFGPDGATAPEESREPRTATPKADGDDVANGWARPNFGPSAVDRAKIARHAAVTVLAAKDPKDRLKMEGT